MKKKLIIGMLGIAMLGFLLRAADHIDAPAVGSLADGSSAADITDFYAFESPENSDNYVFVCNVLGLTAPMSTSDIAFDEDIMYEFNIDNDGDAIEDLVIQAFFRDDQVITFGAVAPAMTGLMSKIYVDNKVVTDVTKYGEAPSIGSSNGIRLFAGPRDDPFFMDFFRFVDIVNGAGAALGLEVAAPQDGMAYPTSFNDTGTDTFAGTNVLSVVIEVPKSSLGSGNTFSAWVESKSRS